MKWADLFQCGSIEREFEEAELECCTRTMEEGYRCGYVAISKGNPAFGKGWDEVYKVLPDLEVDGGVTFAQGDGDTWVFGWDAAHCWHKRDSSLMCEQQKAIRELLSIHTPEAYVVDADMAEAETRKLARQLAKAGDAA